MAQNYPVRSKESWYLARMGWLEWQETALKLAAAACGIAAFSLFFAADKLALPGGWGLVQLVILAVMSIGLFGAIFERLDQREIGAMVFVVINNLGHWGLLLAIVSGLSNGLVIAFGALMLAGEITKLTFFASSNFTVRGSPREFVFAIVAMFALGYAAIMVIEFFF
jgi:hypothetical protein